MHDILAKLDDIHGLGIRHRFMNADYTVSTERLPGPGETVNGGPLQVLPGGKSGKPGGGPRPASSERPHLRRGRLRRQRRLPAGQTTEAGVDTQYVRHVLGPSGTTVIAVDANGENTIIYSPGSNAQVTVEYVESMKGRDHRRPDDRSVPGKPDRHGQPPWPRMGHEAGGHRAAEQLPVHHRAAARADRSLRHPCWSTNTRWPQLLGINEPEDDDWDGMDWHAIADKMHDYGFRQAVITPRRRRFRGHRRRRHPPHLPRARAGPRHHRLR